LLLIESDHALAREVSQRLADSAHVVIDIERSTSLEEACAREHRFDAVMADLWLSDAFGFEVLDRLAARCGCPIIALGTGPDPWLAVQAVRHGAQDYVSKDDVSIVRSILLAVERHRREASLRDRCERQRIANERLERLAETDPLTLVLNRRGLERALFDPRAARRRPHCAMLVDCDDFKMINDDHGHAVGDDVLREIASRLASCLRSSDTVSRIGGDEFLILLAETAEEEAIAIADRARCAIGREPVLTSAGFVSATVSISICALPAHGGSVEQALRHLHAGIAESKQTGKDCVSVSSDLPLVGAEYFAADAK